MSDSGCSVFHGLNPRNPDGVVPDGLWTQGGGHVFGCKLSVNKAVFHGVIISWQIW